MYLFHSTQIFFSVPSLRPLSLRQASEAICKRQVSSAELTRQSLSQIRSLDLKLNAFIAVAHDLANLQARSVDKEIEQGKYRGPMHGIPMAIKDLIDVEAERTTAASRVFASNVAAKDAEVTRRLREAGAIFLGKTNLHEFAYGGSGIISAYGPVLNPWDETRITGGSSSGSAAAVAAGFCQLALGTDTAGSIRLPASYCGIVGFKPSYGLVSADGVVELSRSLDHVGPMTRTVEDSRIAMEAICDLGDEAPPTTMRIGIVRKFFLDRAQPEIARVWEEAISAISRALGRSLPEIEIPISNDRSLQKGESYQFHKQLLVEHSTQYDPQTLQRIKSGAEILPHQIETLRAELTQFRAKSAEVFRDVDIVATLTVSIEPPRIADLEGNPALRETEILMLRNTRPFNVLGWPTITIPCGLTPNGLPVGLQLSAGFRQDRFLLDVAARCESILGFSAIPAILA
jgi:aspartyl-tRNA(Asn)/glutamyl-tRNA(Gln) amidotransferase subunit A